MKWFKGPKESEIVEVKEKLGKFEMISNKLHRSLKIHNSDDDDGAKYWCQVGKNRCHAYYIIIRK